MGSDRKGEPHIHTAAITFHRCIEEFFDLRERNYLVKLRLNLGTAHPQDRPIQINVFASREFRVKAGADFKQAGHATSNTDPAFRWFRDPAQNLQQGRFTCAISPDDADHLPLLNFKRQVFESPEVFGRIVGRRTGGTVGMRSVPTVQEPDFFTDCSEWSYRLSSHYFAESGVTLPFATVPQSIAFADVFDRYNDVRHEIWSCGSRNLNYDSKETNLIALTAAQNLLREVEALPAIFVPNDWTGKITSAFAFRNRKSAIHIVG